MTEGSAILQAAKRLYGEGPLAQRLLQQYRPHICPFDSMLAQVPRGARVLDVGCGSGLFLALLADRNVIGPSVGFDVREPAIALANRMKARLPRPDLLTFCVVPAADPWPVGKFDLVSMIDVMHHIPSHIQESMFERAAAALEPGGMFLYKDMVDKPAWRAWANRLHDLVLARQWIRYLPMDRAVAAARRSGFEALSRMRTNLWWYGHEMAIFRRG